MGKRYLKGRAPPPTVELSKELEFIACCVPAEAELSKEGCTAPTKTELSEDAGSASSTIVLSKDFVCVTSQFPVFESINLKIN